MSQGFGITGLLTKETDHGIVIHEPSWNRDIWIPATKINLLERNVGNNWVTCYVDSQYAARHLDLDDYMG